jgi:hypothetical protein
MMILPAYVKSAERQGEKIYMNDDNTPILPGPDSESAVQGEGDFPVFTVMATATEAGDDLLFDFRVTAPQDPKVMDWLTFVLLTRNKLEILYEDLMEKAIRSYIDLQPETHAEAARMDIEGYARQRTATFEEDAGRGIRPEEAEEE